MHHCLRLAIFTIRKFSCLGFGFLGVALQVLISAEFVQTVELD